MRFKLLNESKLLHWGDLDKGIKADRREIMGGRGTGHFGTGFYFVSEDAYGDMHYDYSSSRPVYELESDSYNLFKPSSNTEAYKLHSALRDINNYSNVYTTSERDIPKEIRTSLEKISDDSFDRVYSSGNDNGYDDEEYRLLSEEYTDLINKYDPNHWFIPQWDLENWSENLMAGNLEDAINDMADDIEKRNKKLKRGIQDVSNILGVSEDKIFNIVKKAYEDTNAEDSISTVVMKGLGYEGVDVSHLNKDADGMSGLDDFAYGTVIYDLKPGTYKRIKEPREQKEQ